jgi:hypothetical protein
MLVAVAGTGLTFGLWWMYFTVPAGQMLHVHRELVFSDGCPSGLSVKSPQLAPALWSCQPWPASEWNTPQGRQRIDIARQRNPQRVADVRSGPAPWTCWQEHVDATAARS